MESYREVHYKEYTVVRLVVGGGVLDLNLPLLFTSHYHCFCQYFMGNVDSLDVIWRQTGAWYVGGNLAGRS